MIKRNPTKPVRVVPPMMEEQEVSTITLQEWLDREETVSHLLFCKGAYCSPETRRYHRSLLATSNHKRVVISSAP